MENKAVSDTGPLLHLSEIHFSKALSIFSSLLVPQEVAFELKKAKVPITKKIRVINLHAQSKDTTKLLTNQHGLDMGEAEAIALALQEKISIFLTDDLDARQVAKIFHLEVHGTIGIILRAYREKIIDKKSALEATHTLKTASSLFITQDLINEVLRAIEDF